MISNAPLQPAIYLVSEVDFLFLRAEQRNHDRGHCSLGNECFPGLDQMILKSQQTTVKSEPIEVDFAVEYWEEERARNEDLDDVLGESTRGGTHDIWAQRFVVKGYTEKKNPPRMRFRDMRTPVGVKDNTTGITKSSTGQQSPLKVTGGTGKTEVALKFGCEFEKLRLLPAESRLKGEQIRNYGSMTFCYDYFRRNRDSRGDKSCTLPKIQHVRTTAHPTRKG
ncbi:hypothetical protein B0H13DRAFT_1856443 [Mycena leptocephala]|nr:hypothetical protein B0H13DRAFT_1856443 [Mycena leptocephala]